MNSSRLSSGLALFRRHALILACAVQTAGALYFAYYFSKCGYLPNPFLSDKSDTFMDLFNTMYWSDTPKMYTDWLSVYPPLTFLLLKIIKSAFLGSVHFNDAFRMRDASLTIDVFLIGIYLIIPVLVFRTETWTNVSIKQKYLIYWLVILSSPMLFTLERGNIIMLAPLLISLALSEAPTLKSVAISVLVNLKPYFVLLLFYYVIKRRWNDFWKCIFMSGGLFLITGLLLDAASLPSKSHFLLLFQNLFVFSHQPQDHSIKHLFEVLAMPSSISSFSYALTSEAFQYIYRSSVITNLTALAQSIVFIKWLVLAITLMALVYNYQRMSEQSVMAVLVVIISNTDILFGGYTLIFYYALIPVFLNMKFKWIYLGILGMLAFPLDILPIMSQPIASGDQLSYLSNSNVQVQMTLGLGSIALPILNFILLIIFCYEVTFGSRRINDPREIIL